MEEAKKVFFNRNRDEEVKRGEREAQKDGRIEKPIQQQAKILALVHPTTVRGSRRERERKKDPRDPPLRCTQCAYCKEDGHWKRECPYHPKGRRVETPTPALSVLVLGDRD